MTITPERILDTRDPVNLGLPGPFVSPVSQKLQVTGSVPTATGTKVVVPTGATGVLLNVTSVGPAANGFISIRPGDATGAPTTSSLNVTAGVTVPNAVQVGLPTSGANAGKIDITFDALGVAGPTTDILIDVVGFTTSAGLQELVADVAQKANVTALPIARSARVNDVTPDPNGTAKVLASVTINAPVPGIIQIVGSTYIYSTTGGTVGCFITSGAGATVSTGALVDSDRADHVPAGNQGSCSTNIALPVGAGTTVVNLVSTAPAGVDLDDTTLDALFIPGGGQTASDEFPAAQEADK